MKSVEFIVRDEVTRERFEAALQDQFGGFTVNVGREFLRDASGKMYEKQVRIYEVVYDERNLDGIRDFVDSTCGEQASFVDVKVDGTDFGVTQKAVVKDHRENVSDWPNEFDIAIQTVIGPELHAVQDHFDMNRYDARSIQGTCYYRGVVFPEHSQRPTTIVTCCQTSAGNDAAGIFAERMIREWNPKYIFLMGIAAGRREKCKIGDVVTPRVIVDDTEGVAEAKKRLKRPRIHAPPHTMIQQLLNFRCEEVRDEWHAQLSAKCPPPKPQAGDESVFEEFVAEIPAHHDAAIYSSDLLLRDPEILEEQSENTHQQIRIGEMEAAGFSEACQSRDVPTPWFVVRGVSDFGDSFKDDQFHKWAAHTAASYLTILIKHGIQILDIV